MIARAVSQRRWSALESAAETERTSFGCGVGCVGCGGETETIATGELMHIEVPRSVLLNASLVVFGVPLFAGLALVALGSALGFSEWLVLITAIGLSGLCCFAVGQTGARLSSSVSNALRIRMDTLHPGATSEQTDGRLTRF